MVASYDHVIYNEYLPVLMGRSTVEKHTLQPGAEGPGSGYIAEVNPGVLASFAVSSYRNPAVSIAMRHDDFLRIDLWFQCVLRCLPWCFVIVVYRFSVIFR